MEKQVNITEIRALEGGKQIKARVNDYSLSKELRGKNGKFREIISREVWQRAIEKAQDKVSVFINHLPYVNIMKNVELRAEDDGVYLYGELIDSADEVHNAVKEGKISQVSFGFRALKDSFKQAIGYIERHVEEMELFEVSLLDCEAAYYGTEIEARALELPKQAWEIELELRQKQLDLYKLM